MSAGTSPAPTPLFEEALQFWEQLVQECEGRAQSINSVLLQQGVHSDGRVRCTAGKQLEFAKAGYPSTTVRAELTLNSWGAVISGQVNGLEDENLEFFPEEFSFPLAKDLDGEIVAIFGEGRSFSPRDVACYLAQSLRRCFPGISLPC